MNYIKHQSFSADVGARADGLRKAITNISSGHSNNLFYCIQCVRKPNLSSPLL